MIGVGRPPFLSLLRCCFSQIFSRKRLFSRVPQKRKRSPLPLLRALKAFSPPLSVDPGMADEGSFLFAVVSRGLLFPRDRCSRLPFSRALGPKRLSALDDIFRFFEVPVPPARPPGLYVQDVGDVLLGRSSPDSEESESGFVETLKRPFMLLQVIGF